MAVANAQAIEASASTGKAAPPQALARMHSSGWSSGATLQSFFFRTAWRWSNRSTLPSFSERRSTAKGCDSEKMHTRKHFRRFRKCMMHKSDQPPLPSREKGSKVGLLDHDCTRTGQQNRKVDLLDHDCTRTGQQGRKVDPLDRGHALIKRQGRKVDLLDHAPAQSKQQGRTGELCDKPPHPSLAHMQKRARAFARTRKEAHTYAAKQDPNATAQQCSGATAPRRCSR